MFEGIDHSDTLQKSSIIWHVFAFVKNRKTTNVLVAPSPTPAVLPRILVSQLLCQLLWSQAKMIHSLLHIMSQQGATSLARVMTLAATPTD